jgi:hypothetical protein
VETVARWEVEGEQQRHSQQKTETEEFVGKFRFREGVCVVCCLTWCLFVWQDPVIMISSC